MVNGGSNIVDVKYDEIKIDDDRHKSVLFSIGGKDVWLPRSLIEVDEAGMTVVMPQWKCELEGLENEVE